MQKTKLKQYSIILILGIILIVIFKVFDPSWFTVVLKAFYPVIIGATLAYILYPLVKILENCFNNNQSKFISKHSRVISILIVFLALIVLLVLLLYWLIPVIMSYIIELINNIDYYYFHLRGKCIIFCDSWAGKVLCYHIMSGKSWYNRLCHRQVQEAVQDWFDCGLPVHRYRTLYKRFRYSIYIWHTCGAQTDDNAAVLQA